MELYQSISKYYDFIFPLNNNQVKLVIKEIAPNSTLLDVGCATGSLSHALANRNYQVSGFDLDSEMIEIKAACFDFLSM